MSELLERLTSDMAYIQKLGDNPNSDNGFTAEMLKAWFDQAPLAIQNYLNTVLIPQIETKFGSIDKWITEAGGKIDAFVVGTGFVPVDGSVAMTGNLNMGGMTVTNLAKPVANTDAVTKSYADSINEKAESANSAAVTAQETADGKCRKFNLRVNLLKNGWSGNYQIVYAPGVLADETLCDVLTSPVEASREIYSDCVVRCSEQKTDSLTFMCDDVPDKDLTVSVIVII